MVFFDLKAVCDICGEEVGLNRYKTAEGWICPNCFKACGYSMTTPIKTKTIEQIRSDLDAKNKNMEMVDSFTPTKKIGTYIEFDENQKKWLIPDGFMGKKKNPKVYNYSDIIDCDLIEDEDSITKGGLGRAVAGGLLFGGVGAIVGGVTGGKKTKSIVKSLKIKITVNDMTNPVAYVTLINSPIKTSSLIYKTVEKTAHEILSVIAVILNENAASNPTAEVSMGEANEIRKYKQLLDDGIITQEEFETKKKQLLGI